MDQAKEWDSKYNLARSADKSDGKNLSALLKEA